MSKLYIIDTNITNPGHHYSCKFCLLYVMNYMSIGG